jgi:hypothetical protein
VTDFLFDTVAKTGSITVTAVQLLISLVSRVIGIFFGCLLWLVANFFRLALIVISKKRYDHASSAIEQSELSSELKILEAVTKVKEDALTRKKWTEEHSLALNQLGSQLYHECDWSEASIHHYMRGIVESLPGLTYVGGDPDDEDDEDGFTPE